MYRLLAVCLFVFVSLSGRPSAEPIADQASQFVGVWDGEMNGLPAVEVALTDDGGKVRGTIAFYLQMLDKDGKWHVVGDKNKAAQPLLSPRIEGNVLTFEVTHAKKHGSPELGPNKTFRVEVAGATTAYLREAGDSSDAPGHGLKLSRTSASAQDSASRGDPSQHQVQFVMVEEGIRLEVLDWGGSGRALVLLAGSGNTAHVFDGFAEKLTDCCHVYGITRRGSGASSHPDSGYTDQRLADDVLQVLDSLKIVAPVLIGHSMAGSELTTLGDQHSDRLAGLVYLDAGSDPKDFPASDPKYMELFHNLPPAMRNHPAPSAADRSSPQAYRDWQVRNGEVAFPEGELRNAFESNPDGSVGKSTTPASVHNAIGEGSKKRDYSKIRVPVVAFFAIPGSVDDPKNRTPKGAQERAAAEAFNAATVAYIKKYEWSLLAAQPNARVIELSGAHHYIFLSNEAEVLREIHAFVAGLHSKE